MEKRGFTLIELLVVISIVGVLLGLLMPAVQAARESARRSACGNNLKQIASAVHMYEARFTSMPSGGQGTDFKQSPPVTIFDSQSVFTQILPSLDQQLLMKGYDLTHSYRDGAHAAQNVTIARKALNVLLCPSNPFASYEDPFGYGQTDYFATAYTDLDPNLGVRNRGMRANGALAVPAASMAAITDGVSETMMFIEDVGRLHPSLMYNTMSAYPDPDCSNGNADSGDCSATQYNGGSGPQSNGRTLNRWADPAAGGGGISGPPNAGQGYQRYLNQNAVPLGGPSACPWSTSNCGPNEEPFSFHPGGCNSAFADGSVHFLSESISAVVLRELVTRAEGVPADVPW